MGLGMDRLAMLMTNKTSIQDVLFFPQMKPEKSKANSESEIGEPGAAEVLPQSPGSPAEAATDGPGPELDLTDEEKLVLKLLQANSPVDLNKLKGQTGLSNKKWDKAIKGLRAHNIAKVEKTAEGLIVELV